jgi:hypothetical protein
MAVVTTTSINWGGTDITLRDEQFRDEVVTFAGAATIVRGTILGRITATGKLKAWASGSSDGSQVPIAVAAYDIVATGAGDVAARVIVRGEVRRNHLIIDADGTGVNITPALIDQLRDYGILPVDVQTIGI